jgi:catechol 2,3-dioxygenase-like lactoylglutathione lyase family enzyme
MGHVALHVKDLDAAVEFQQQIIGMVETDRLANASYMTCSDRHHELILIEDPLHRGYEHLALEVADASVLEDAAKRLTAAGGTMLGDIYDGEPGIDRALKVKSPAGHVYKLFCGMETIEPPPPGDRPSSSTSPARSPTTAPRSTSSPRGLGCASATEWDSWPPGGTATRTITAWPSPSPPAPSSPTTPTSGTTSPRSAESPTGSRPLAIASASGGPSRHGPGNNHFLYSTTRTAR